MKRTLPALLVAMSMALPLVSMAQGHDDHDRRDHGHDSHAQPAHHDDRGAGPDHRFHRGDRLPTDYRSRQYVVDDWRGHHLKAPPRGYHWVQTGPDYVLAAIATGVIADVLLSQ
jgi:Ni/Co efflux regulator RcnB